MIRLRFRTHLGIGKPLSDIEARSHEKTGEQLVDDIAKTPSEIVFVRNRMLYARAALNAHGVVHFGLRHIRKTLVTLNSR